MYSQLYLDGRVFSGPELGQTKKGRLWVKLVLETTLVRETRPGEFQSELVILPVRIFGQQAEQVKGLQKGDSLALGAHLNGTEFQPEGGSVSRGIQLIADIVFITKG